MAQKSKAENKVKVEKAKKEKPVKLYSDWDEYIYSSVVPYFINVKDSVVSILTNYMETKEITKEDWNLLYSYVDKMTDLSKDQDVIIAFDRKFLKAKYREKHSSFYRVQAGTHAKHALSNIAYANTLSNEDEKEYKVGRYFRAAQHLFFFITAKEKLEASIIEDNEA